MEILGAISFILTSFTIGVIVGHEWTIKTLIQELEKEIKQRKMDETQTK